MKLKLLFFSLFCLTASVSSSLASDDGLHYVKKNGTVRCGTDLSSKILAYQEEIEEEKVWRGFDVDICRAYSMAIFGIPTRFEMVNVASAQADDALSARKIDVMLGQVPLTAKLEIEKKSTEAGILYYDRQMFVGKKIPDATSMEAYKGGRVCVVMGSEDLDNIQEFSARHGLGLEMLFFLNAEKAREAFLLSRCDLLSGSEIYIKGLMKNFLSHQRFMLIPETIALRPIYALVKSDNNTMRIFSKWIINALILAEDKEITSKNLEMFASDDGIVIKNLLGIDEKLWKKFGLKPDWVKKYIAEYGNYAEVYERNLGEGSELNIKRGENNLLRKGGLLQLQPFL